MSKKSERPKLRLVYSRKTSGEAEKKDQPVEGEPGTVEKALENQAKKSKKQNLPKRPKVL